MLDVAAGTGHLARALAPHVRQVIAIDVTPIAFKVNDGDLDSVFAIKTIDLVSP